MNEIVLVSVFFILLVILLILIALVIRIYRVESKRRYDVKQKSSTLTRTSNDDKKCPSSIDAYPVKTLARAASDQDNYFQMTQRTDEERRSENSSPVFDFRNEHIYAEIHPKYLPQILQGKQNKNDYIGRVQSAEPSKKIEKQCDDDYYTSRSSSSTDDKKQEGDLRHLETWYELPMESTFIHTKMSGEII